MNEKVDSAENIQVSLTHMVESLNNMKQQADAAIVEAGENKPKRQRTEEHGCGGSASETLGSKGKGNGAFWEARQVDLTETCSWQSTGPSAALLNWGHSFVRDPAFETMWEASISGLDLAWEMGTLHLGKTSPSDHDSMQGPLSA